MKAIDLLVKIIAWLQIVASPLIAGLLIAVIVYANIPGTLGLILALLLSASGLIGGIVFATRTWKKKGAVEFISRVSATPELDEIDQTKKP